MFKIDGSCWLTAGEQEEIIAQLIDWRLLKWDNARKLPLKMGGTTDIYVNLRDARSKPAAIRGLARIYANPIGRLEPQRIIEVPDAVSPIAGQLSAITDVPLVTIREEAKAGRVVSGKFVGDIGFGDAAALLDDVVTDGKSKIPPLSELRRIGAKLSALVVLVDRQQGWKKKLAEAGFGDVPVWAGMTLHHVRKFLVSQHLMERCDTDVEVKNPIVVALDGKDWEEILPVIDPLRTTGCILKVNDLLFDQGIANLLPDLSVYGRVMADLKGHDIPNTVANICKRLRKCPPWAVTVHASGGGDMIRVAKTELEGTPTKVLAVTVLTSLDAKTCGDIYKFQPADQVSNLAEIACLAGADGFVCSPQEVTRLKACYPNKLLVTPGVRSPGADVNDQVRIDTPANAMEKGSTHLVMGRQILGAKDPVAEVNRILAQELKINL